MDKQSYRSIALYRRDQISKEDRSRFSNIISDKLLERIDMSAVDNVLIYCSYLSEVSTYYLITKFLYMGKKVFCPKVISSKDGIMDFYRITDKTQLKEGFHRIPEPVTDDKYATGCEMAHNTTIMIMPGVAFDRECNRIGYKGGFYDRYILRIPGALLIALSFDEQIFDCIFTMEDHDIKVNEIYTPTEVLKAH